MKRPHAVHLVGIGGAGMRGLARLLHEAGTRVSGSDAGGPGRLAGLGDLRGPIRAGHDAANLPRRCDLVVRTIAASEDNPELVAARERGIPVQRYPEALAAVLEGREGIAVTGTHGKGTTGTILVHLLLAAGVHPAWLIGGDPIGLEGSAHWEPEGPWVAEACEFRRSFLQLRPRTIVVTNVDDDHLDYYAGMAQIRQAFREFLGLLPRGEGLAVLPFREARHLTRGVPEGVRAVTYGLRAGADVRAVQVRRGPSGYGFRIHWRGRDLGRMRLNVPGRHQVQNALGAATAALEVGVPAGAVRDGLASFRGLRRRLEVLGTFAGVTVVDDYAHHPTEIKAGLDTAREHLHPHRLVAAFEPHLYSRTRLLLEEFAESLAAADLAVILDIYAAREPQDPSERISSLDLVLAVRRHGGNALYASSIDDAMVQLEGKVFSGDVVLVQGAGDATVLAHALARRFGKQRATGAGK